MPTTAAIIVSTTGVRWNRKSVNESSSADPMRMFGGSPISVAVPPILDAKILISRYGYGLTSSLLAICIVTGTTSSTVVTLSRNAENTAVTKPMTIKMPSGCARTFFAPHTATY